MRPVSERFLSTLRGSHRAVTQAFVVAPGQTGVSPTGTQIEVLRGDVYLDSAASIRSTLDLTTPGEGAFPESASDLLAPYGNEVFVRRGIAFSGGSVEWVSLGYHRINRAEQPNAPHGSIRLDCSDRMAGIVEARLLAPAQYDPGWFYGEVIEDLVQEVYPWATIEWDDDTETEPIGRSVIEEQDRFAFLDDLVTSVGKIWYWDHRGVLVVKDPPDPAEPSWTVNEGESGVLVSLSRDLAREGVYNAVVASGEALDTSPPARGVAVDDNPDSPTYWEGDFGKVPRFYESSFITTDGQALTAAAAILRQNLGLPYNVDFQQIPNPALEPYDAVEVRYGGRVETHVIDTMTVPLLSADTQSATTREQTLVVIGEA